MGNYEVGTSYGVMRFETVHDAVMAFLMVYSYEFPSKKQPTMNFVKHCMETASDSCYEVNPLYVRNFG